MSKILIKKISAYGRMPHPGDKYVSIEGMLDLDVKMSYQKAREFLELHAQQIIPHTTKEPPFKGMIWNKAGACYVFNNCLIGNVMMDYCDFSRGDDHAHGVKHSIIIGVSGEDQSLLQPLVEDTLCMLKHNSTWYVPLNNWEVEDFKITEIPEKLDNISHMLSYLPKLLNK